MVTKKEEFPIELDENLKTKLSGINAANKFKVKAKTEEEENDGIIIWNAH